ncbi:MAG TPA: hypothetical protein VEB19_10795 [Gemmatimonadaceae bacterium]|nr:hypothetical protein [Gemmatimonadaceae bacterium]
MLPQCRWNETQANGTEARWLEYNCLNRTTCHSGGTLTIDDNRSERLIPFGVIAGDVTYRGRRAVSLVERDESIPGRARGASVALLNDVSFRRGTIEIDVAGLPRAGADSSLRGFVGMAFHVSDDAAAFRAFYLRPTNGRAQDQLRRNHATQYIAMPGYPWQRLRREQPGVYESYPDLVAGEWTPMRIEVGDSTAMLFLTDLTSRR